MLVDKINLNKIKTLVCYRLFLTVKQNCNVIVGFIFESNITHMCISYSFSQSFSPGKIQQSIQSAVHLSLTPCGKSSRQIMDGFLDGCMCMDFFFTSYLTCAEVETFLQ